MNTDIFSVMKKRRTCRRFTTTSISRDELLLLAEYGTYAPSAANVQDYAFIITVDKEKMLKLPELCMDQDFISQASGAIIVCSRPEQLANYFANPEYLASQSAAAAAQNILLAAEAHGFGAAWIGGFDRSKVAELFEIPKKSRVEVIIPVGFPAGRPDPKTSKIHRLLIYFEKFGNDKKDKEFRHHNYADMIERQLQKSKKKVEKEAEKRGLKERVKNFLFKEETATKDESLNEKKPPVVVHQSDTIIHKDHMN